MKISILCPDLSGNCLVRPYILAKILQRRYEVEIAGPMFGDGIWQPVAKAKDIAYKPVRLAVDRIATCYHQVLGMLKELDGDVIYAHKPLFGSYGIAVLHALRRGLPLLLDIEDWQLGLVRQSRRELTPRRRISKLVEGAILLYGMDSYWGTLMGETLSIFADDITVSNRFLAQRFGGTLVWHARDTEAFDPAKYDGEAIRQELGIGADRRVVVFSGTPHPHKGVDDLIEAVARIPDPKALLVVVGLKSSDAYSQQIQRRGQSALGDRFVGLDSVPFERAPEILALADVVAVPQRRNMATVGQIPAKIFDGMAMAKPVVSTNVCDIPEILRGCGWVVEPGRPRELARVIEHVLGHPEEAAEVGRKARQKCLREYSYDAMEPVLMGLLSKYA